MYKTFFGLQRNPFEISPDPAFYSATPQHNEAICSLYYGITRRKGVVVLTGEVGTGKTLLLRYLMTALQREQVAFAYIFNTLLSPLEFLQSASADLGLEYAGKGKIELLQQLNAFLLQRHRAGRITALIIDEAQLLSTEVLEEVRLLTNLETTGEKLLQILLIGQPELDEKLESPDLRQLKQRIALRWRLMPLNLAETGSYIARRLSIAGCATPGEVIPGVTALRVYEYTTGIPRLINTLCENSLIAGYARQVKPINPSIVDDAAAGLRLRRTRAREAELLKIVANPGDGNTVREAAKV